MPGLIPRDQDEGEEEIEWEGIEVDAEEGAGVDAEEEVGVDSAGEEREDEDWDGPITQEPAMEQ
eukprot:1438116-Ditylum_brightwellii.AAC.1